MNPLFLLQPHSFQRLLNTVRSWGALALLCCASLTAEASTITGRVFVDHNGDSLAGPADYGWPGVVVTAHTSTGALAGTATTDSNGHYTLSASTSAGAPLRLEFSGLPGHLKPGRQNPATGTTVRFLGTNSASDCNLSLIDPLRYSASATVPVVTSRFLEGEITGPYQSLAGLMVVPSNATGHHFEAQPEPSSGFQAATIAPFAGIGAVYAIAHQTSRNRLFVASYHKRHSGFGPSGPDAIYIFDSITRQALGTLDLDLLVGGTHSTGSDAHNFTPTDGQVLDIGSADNTNSESFDGVGKRSFGDMQMSPDMRTLYVVNLFTRQIHALDVSGATLAQVAILQTWNAPDATGAGRHRPFSLACHEGRLWVGSVDENASFAYVHSFVPVGHSPAMTLELALPLNYPRQAFIGAANNPNRLANWRPWVSSPNFTPLSTNANEIGWPQPMLTAIEFSGRNMMLGFRDRFGDQAGYRKRFRRTDTEDSFPISAGDLLLICRTSSGWAVEGSPECPTSGGLVFSGPGGAASPEHFEWDVYGDQGTWNVQSTGGALHWETTQGALMQIPGQPTVMTTAMNPFSDFSGGLLRFDLATGRREGITANSTPPPSNGGYTLYEGGDLEADFPAESGFFNEANGLGAIEALLEPPPIEIGNRVWLDANDNGVQDAGESGIPGVQLELYDPTGTRVATTTTSSDPTADLRGTFVFSGLSPFTAYWVVIPPAQFDNGNALAGLRTARLQTTTSGINSDAARLASLPPALAALEGRVGVSFTTAGPGESDHTLDLGFRSCPAITVNPPQLPQLTVGTNFSQQLLADTTAASSPFTFLSSSGALPEGLSLTLAGRLNGTPNTPGAYSFTINATDADGCGGTRAYQVRVCPVISLPASLPTASIRSPYQHVLNPSGGQAPYVFALFESELPAGISLTDGQLTGTPTAVPGVYSFTIRVTDAAGCLMDFPLQLTVVTATVSGRVYEDSNASRSQDAGEAGLQGIPVAVTDATGETRTIATDPDGNWTIQVAPGDASIMLDLQSAGFPIRAVLSQGSNPAQISVLPGSTQSIEAFGLIPLPARSWPVWQFLNDLNGENGPNDDPDGDSIGNLAEFAFSSVPNSGIQVLCPLILQTQPTSNQVDARLLRVTGLTGVTYHLETLTDLAQSPAGWIDAALLPPTVTYHSDGTESAVFQDVLSQLPPSATRFFRVRVELDADLNGLPEAVTRTETVGVLRRSHNPQIESLSLPFASCPVFAGTVDSVAGALLMIGSSSGSGDFSAMLESQHTYFLEVTSGDHEGHRFQIHREASTPTAIAVDLSSPRNTLASVPAALAGASVIVRRYPTLDSAFVKADLQATNNPATASRVLIYEGGVFRSWWLFRNGGNPVWVREGDASLANNGSRILDPSSGLLLQSRISAKLLTLTGIVRSHAFVQPLTPGFNLAANPWPMNLSPTQRGFTPSMGFAGSTSASQADRILLWSADAVSGGTGYTGHFLFQSGALRRWVSERDASLNDLSEQTLFAPGRAALIRSRNGLSSHRQNRPWTP